MREIYTPGATTIAALCGLLDCTADQTLKSVFYTTGDEIILALIRGDLDVAEMKLRNMLTRRCVALAEEATAFGLITGYTGPVGLTGRPRIVVDDRVPPAGSLVSGANRTDYHLAA